MQSNQFVINSLNETRRSTNGRNQVLQQKKEWRSLGKAMIFIYEFPQTPKIAPLKAIMGNRKQKTKKKYLYHKSYCEKKQNFVCEKKSYKMFCFARGGRENFLSLKADTFMVYFSKCLASMHRI